MREYIFERPDEAEDTAKRDANYRGELIRCMECIFWMRYCRIVDGVVTNHVCARAREIDGTMHRANANDFCSWAERK